MSSTVAVEDLRLGMYIHLEGGWLSHPFALSAFRITSAAEIATIRALGLARVHWVPEKSELASPAAGASAPATAVPVTPVPPSPAQRAAEQQRQWLAHQREAALRCERQHVEAAKAWREATDALAAQPALAAATTVALTQAMLDKMLATEELGIRLVSGGGDCAAAHALNVTVISMLIGRALGLAGDELLDLGVGALQHDVGKQGLPERLRHIEDGFTTAELNGYREHVARGLQQGQRMKLSAGALAVIAQHHEHADGSGFPLHLASEKMSLGARIVAIVNRFDNLCNPATRTLPLTPHEAVAMLFTQSRTRFDPPVLNAFIRMMGVYPAGSLVQLTDDRYAMVMGVNATRPLKPRVLVHGAVPARAGLRAAAASEAQAQMLDLETQPDLGIRRSLAASKVPPLVLAALDPRPRVAYYFEPLVREAQPLELAA